MKSGLKSREVKKEEYGQSLGYLAGIEGYEEIPNADNLDFSDEMLVLCGLSDRQTGVLLPALRKAGVSISLKAALTETNADWSSSQLHEELIREREAFEQTGKSIH
ncbi:MAG: DUF3783 domain-containing protein [Oscillospiraceae bacterium]|nr:DUF3783 domain-containing protein [Oscillospiraceae bacterium]